MSLVADYSSTSDEESSGENEEESKEKPQPKAALPSANDLLSGGRAGEVFNNPYKEAEDAQLASLEQHVKMVNTKDNALRSDKKICWNYRKGRCRFGSNCSFMHDSDLQVDSNQASQTEAGKTKHIPSISIISKPQHGLQIGGASGGGANSSKPLKTRSEAKRPHPGLGDSITPSKKTVKQYNKNKVGNNLP